MKLHRLAATTLTSLLLASLATLPAFAAWQQPQFALGTFWDARQNCPSGACGADSAADLVSFQRAKDAYFNLLTGTGDNASDYAANCTAGAGCYPACIMAPVRVDQTTWGQKYALRVATRAGLSYLIRDYGYWKNELIPTTQLNSIINALLFADPVTLSHLYGFNFWDEVPEALSRAPGIRGTIGRFHQAASGRPVYASLFPHYECFPAEGTNCPGAQKFPTRAAYETYVQTYSAAASGSQHPPDIMAYDHYPFTGLGVRQEYFYNLSYLRNQAGTRPLWAHVMTTGHGFLPSGAPGFYPDPSGGQMRFMSFCPVAYGAKGLIFFTYELPTATPCPSNYWNGTALVGSNGLPNQPKFDQVKAINRYITYTLGPMVMSRTFVKAYHATSAPTGEPVPAGEALASSTLLKWTNNSNLLFGVFSGDAGGNHIVVVNKDWNSSASGVLVDVQGNRSIAISAASDHPTGGQGTSYTPIPGVYDPALNRTRFAVSTLEPGGAVIVRVSASGGGGGCGDPPCEIEPAIAPAQGLLVMPNPTRGTTSFVLADRGQRLESVTLYDLAGREIAVLRGSEGAAERVTWSGRDAAGAVPKPGVYMYVARTTGGVLKGRFSLIR